MQIVSQSASLSYSPSPSWPLLPAPPVRKQICAPHIGGLLPARTAPPLEIATQEPLSHDELLRRLGPIRSREQMNAEIADLALEALQFLNGLHSRPVRRLAKERGR